MRKVIENSALVQISEEMLAFQDVTINAARFISQIHQPPTVLIPSTT